MKTYSALPLVACLLLGACDKMQSLTGTGNEAHIVAARAKDLRAEHKTLAALALLREADAQLPNNPEILLQLGNVLVEAGENKDAIAVFDKLIALDAKNASAHSGKGVALDHLNKHTAAQNEYSKALALDPNNIATQNNLGMSYILGHEPKKALTLLEPLVEKNPDNKTLRHNLALAYGVIGNSKKSLELDGKDLTPAQAEENQRFYQQYKKLDKRTASKVLPE